MFQREEIEAICAYLFCQLLQCDCIANFRRAVDHLTTYMEREDMCDVLISDCMVFKGSVAALEARAILLMVFQVYERCIQPVAPI